MDKKEIYKGTALLPKNPRQTMLLILLILTVSALLFYLAKFFFASWFFEVCIIVFDAVYLNKALKQGTFVKTYILYQDCLVETTRYGLIEKETGRFVLNSSSISENEIICENKSYPFYPDETLKKLLNL